MTMSINEAKAKFYALPIAEQCRYWNVFAQITKDKDHVYIFLFLNETLEDFYEALNQFPKCYDLDPSEMFTLGVLNNPHEKSTKYMYLDTENHEIITVNSIEECVNEETIEAFFELWTR